MEEANVKLVVHVDQTEIDQAIRKLERLNELLKEASSLAGELASTELTISATLTEG